MTELWILRSLLLIVYAASFRLSNGFIVPSNAFLKCPPLSKAATGRDVASFNEEIERVAGQAGQIEALIESMKKQNIQPNVMSYSYLLDALEDGVKAERVMKTLETECNHKSTVMYNKVLTVWKKQNDVPSAEKLFQYMIQHKFADNISYSCFIDILANQGTMESAQRAQALAESLDSPNTQVWNTVMKAWIKAGDLEQAENIFEALEFNLVKTSNKNKQNSPTPNTISYSLLMEGWSKRNNVDRAEELFEDMLLISRNNNNPDSQANMYCYVSLINCYARQGRASHAQKAESLLKKMHQSGSAEIQPNTQLITTVMDAWQKCGQPEKAEALLYWMVDMYIQTGDKSIMPNEYSFSTAITAWGRSRRIGKSVKARAILNKMKDLCESGVLTCSPNTHCFTAVISSCAYCENDAQDKETALKIAISTYRELQQSVRFAPNHVTYSSVLAALRHLVPTSPKRTSAVQDVFRAAVKHGYVDQNVVRRLQSALDADDLESLIPNFSNDMRVDELPAAWRRNVAALL